MSNEILKRISDLEETVEGALDAITDALDEISKELQLLDVGNLIIDDYINIIRQYSLKLSQGDDGK